MLKFEKKKIVPAKIQSSRSPKDNQIETSIKKIVIYFSLVDSTIY